eukprot:6735588-Pyramimonas_sp.AAC.1
MALSERIAHRMWSLFLQSFKQKAKKSEGPYISLKDSDNVKLEPCGLEDFEIGRVLGTGRWEQP